MSDPVTARGAPVVRLEQVWKSFPRPDASLPGTLKEALLHGRVLRRQGRFTALRDVNLRVEPGSICGLIGPNGAGKSTLLRLTAGISRPDQGVVEATPERAAILQLGTDFHPELTGRENVLVAGVVAGLGRRAARAAVADICAFAELEDFIDAPLRVYSTGMRARLAFAVATYSAPRLLLVDEVLAVGDLSFQVRCLERLRELHRQGAAILLVSHDVALVADLCDRLVWLRGGRVVASGPPANILDRYRDAMAEETRRLTPHEVAVERTPGGRDLLIHENRFGSQEAQLHSVRLLDGWGAPAEALPAGAALRLRLSVTADPPVGAAHIGVTLTRVDGLVCVDTARALHAAGEQELELLVERLDLSSGDYAVSVGLFREDWGRTYDYHWQAYPLTIVGQPAERAVLSPPHAWSVRKMTLDKPSRSGSPVPID